MKNTFSVFSWSGLLNLFALPPNFHMEKYLYWSKVKMGFPGGSDSKESACNAGDLGLIPESGRSSGERTGYPFQYSCLEHSMDRGVWCTTVHRIPKSWTLLRLTLSLSRWKRLSNGGKILLKVSLENRWRRSHHCSCHLPSHWSTSSPWTWPVKAALTQSLKSSAFGVGELTPRP